VSVNEVALQMVKGVKVNKQMQQDAKYNTIQSVMLKVSYFFLDLLLFIASLAAPTSYSMLHVYYTHFLLILQTV
jgi:hypothetical protein